mgnify:CR=1 FL=1
MTDGRTLKAWRHSCPNGENTMPWQIESSLSIRQRESSPAPSWDTPTRESCCWRPTTESNPSPQGMWMYVESREKKGESSAWLARVGAPARRFRRASIEGGEARIFYCFRAFRGLNCFNIIRVHSCPFVSIRVHSWFKCINIFVYFVLFVV